MTAKQDQHKHHDDRLSERLPGCSPTLEVAGGWEDAMCALGRGGLSVYIQITEESFIFILRSDIWFLAD